MSESTSAESASLPQKVAYLWQAVLTFNLLAALVSIFIILVLIFVDTRAYSLATSVYSLVTSTYYLAILVFIL